MNKTTVEKKETIWSLPFIFLMIISLFDSLSFSMLRTMMTQYAIDIGIAETAAATIVSVMSVASLIMRPVAGRLVDCFNNKRIMTFTFAGTVLTMICYFFARTYWLLILVRLMHGICYGITAVVSLTIVGSLLPEKKMGNGIAMYGMGLVVSITFSTMIGVAVYSLGANALFGASLLSSVICLVLSLFVPDSKRELQKPGKISLGRTLKGLLAKEALPIAFLYFLLQLAQSAMGVYLVVYLNARADIGSPGVMFFFWGLMLFLARPVSGKLYDKFGVAPVLVLCFACYAIFNIMLSLSVGPWMTYIAGLFGSFGFGGAVPVLQAAAFNSVEPARKGAANSTALIGSDLGASLGGICCGQILGMMAVDGVIVAASYQRMFMCMIVPLAIGIVFCFILLRKRKSVGQGAE